MQMRNNAGMTRAAASARLWILVMLAGMWAQMAAASTSDAVLSEVILSATRTAQQRADYAGSIDRIDSQELQLIGAQHYADALNRVPGVFIQRGSGQEGLIALRSPVLTGAGSCGAFLVLEDSLPIRPTGFCNVNELFEVNTDQAAALEVLRGAAPTLYGANAVHGIINVTTPNTEDIRAAGLALQSGANAYERLRFNVAANNELAAYGTVISDGGWRVHSASDEAKLNVIGDHPVAGGTLHLTAAGTLLNQQTAGFISGKDAYRNDALSRSNANPEAFRDAWASRLAATWRRAEPNGGQTQIAAMLRDSSMHFLQHFLPGEPLERNRQISALLSFSHRSSVTDHLQWAAGADFEAANAALLEIQSGPTLQGSAAARAIRPAGRHYDYAVNAITTGAWLEADYPLSRHLSLGGGLRADVTYNRYDNRMLAGNTDEFGIACPFGGCLYSRPADRNDQFVNVAPRLHVRYSATAAHSLYAVVARGFRPPEATELYRLQRQQSTAPLQSEVLDSAELGWVATYPALRWSMAAFTMRKRHVILRDSNGFNISDGRTSHQGLEYSMAWQFLRSWQLALAGSYSRHRYDFSLAIDGGDAIIAGNDVDTAPRTLQNLRLRYDLRPRLQAELELVRVGAYFTDAANLAPYPGHRLANLHVDWRFAAHWSASLRIENLGDSRYADRADFANGNYRYIPGRGRSSFVQLQWRND